MGISKKYHTGQNQEENMEKDIEVEFETPEEYTEVIKEGEIIE